MLKRLVDFTALALAVGIVGAIPRVAEGAPPDQRARRVSGGAEEKSQLEQVTCDQRLDELLRAEQELRGKLYTLERERDAALERVRAVEEKLDALEQTPTAKTLQRQNALDERKLALEERQLEAREDASNSAACASSKACSDFGNCSFVRNVGCVPKTDAHCRKAKACIYLGRCEVSGADEAGVCISTNDADCKRSLVCKREGLCTYSDTMRECY